MSSNWKETRCRNGAVLKRGQIRYPLSLHRQESPLFKTQSEKETERDRKRDEKKKKKRFSYRGDSLPCFKVKLVMQYGGSDTNVYSHNV